MLQNKTVLVTGATGGIGRAISSLFAEQGADLILTGKNQEKLEALCNDIKSHSHSQVTGIVADLSEHTDISALFRQLNQLKTPLNVIVNNAGVMDSALLPMTSSASIERSFSTNVYSVLGVCQYGARMLKRHGGGSIVNLSSRVGLTGAAGQSVYSATKAAIVGITKSLSKELADDGIRVNALAPGLIDTTLLEALPEDTLKKQIDSVCLKRLGTPLEVANVALFLASDLSSYITGQVIGVDGGFDN